MEQETFFGNSRLSRPIEQEITRAGKSFILPSNCVCFHLNFPLLKFLIRNSKWRQFQNNFLLFQTLLCMNLVRAALAD